MTMKPCDCPLCRAPMRNLPHGSRTWHCSECGETMTDGYARLFGPHVPVQTQATLEAGHGG